MAKYVALLRAINVGGNNLIRMPALKACFEAQGFRDVSTYIQSGNLLFSADQSNSGALADRIEKSFDSVDDRRLPEARGDSVEHAGPVHLLVSPRNGAIEKHAPLPAIAGWKPQTPERNSKYNDVAARGAFGF